MIQGMDDMPGGGKIIKAEVPLSEMFGYSTTLRSMSQGRATYTMEFKHYDRSVAEEHRRSEHPTSRRARASPHRKAGLHRYIDCASGSQHSRWHLQRHRHCS